MNAAYEKTIYPKQKNCHTQIDLITASAASSKDLRFGSSIQAMLSYVIDDNVVEHVFHG